MDNLLDENTKLKKEIRNLKQVIKKQNAVINDLRDNWIINLFNSLQAIIDEYSIFLNPPEILLKASYQNKSEAYKIKTENLICVFSIGRTKKLLFGTNICGIGNNERDTNLISIENPWDILLPNLDSKKFHLCKIDKSTYVNVKYYDLLQDELIVKAKIENTSAKYEKFTIKGKYKFNFIQMKEQYDKIFSLQKLLVDYKLKNGFPI